MAFRTLIDFVYQLVSDYTRRDRNFGLQLTCNHGLVDKLKILSYRYCALLVLCDNCVDVSNSCSASQ